MFRKPAAMVIFSFIVVLAPQWGNFYPFAAEKVKIGTAVKLSPMYYLPVFAAEEHGFWRQNGLDAEYVPFAGGTPFYQAMAAGSIGIGLSSAVAGIQSASRGVPVVIIAGLYPKLPFFIWVRADSPFKVPGALRGTKIGVSRLGGSEHAYGRTVAKALGLEKEIRFISTGGISESIAALRTASIDAVVLTTFEMVELKLGGQVRELVSVIDYLPQYWEDNVVIAHRDFLKNRPDTAKKVVKVIIQSVNFIKGNPRWAKEKMKSEQGFSEGAAKALADILDFTKDGRIDKRGLESIRNFFIEYGIISREQTPPVDQLYTDQFFPG